MAAKPKTSSANASFHVIVGTDEGLVREEALALYNELTGGNDDGFTHETINGNADVGIGKIAPTSRRAAAFPGFAFPGKSPAKPLPQWRGDSPVAGKFPFLFP